MRIISRIITVFVLAVNTVSVNAFVNITCDVIYKNNDGEWSKFLRTNVTFCLGHEIHEISDSRSVFAVVRTPDYESVILKMKGIHIQPHELDYFNTFLLLSTNDMINHGIDFELYNASIAQDWKVYPKNEIGLLIDERLSNTEFGKKYNEKTLENREKGCKLDRIKPKNNPKHVGESGEIVYKDQWLYYIVKLKDRYVAVERKDCSIRKCEIGDTLIGDYSVRSIPQTFYNQSHDCDGYIFYVLKESDSYEDCEKYIRSEWP